MDKIEKKLKQTERYIDETVSFGKIQAEILLDFMENNKKAIDKHSNRVALLVIRDNLKTFISYRLDAQGRVTKSTSPQ